jgi:hypothetical protein
VDVAVLNVEAAPGVQQVVADAIPGSSTATPSASSSARCSHAPIPSSAWPCSLPSVRTISATDGTSLPRCSSPGRAHGAASRRPPLSTSGSSHKSNVVLLSWSGIFIVAQTLTPPGAVCAVQSEARKKVGPIALWAEAHRKGLKATKTSPPIASNAHCRHQALNLPRSCALLAPRCGDGDRDVQGANSHQRLLQEGAQT